MKLNQNLKRLGIGLLFVCLVINSILAYSRTDDFTGFRFEEGKYQSSFKFSIENDLIVLPVTVEGKRLNFIFDTGMNSILVFDKRNIKDWRARDKHKIKFSGLGVNNLVQGIRFDGLSVNMPNIQGKGLSLVATQYSSFSEQFESIEIHGIFGYQLLAKFIVQIDYANKSITLINPDYFVKPYNASQLDLSIINTKPYINCPIIVDEKSYELNFLVDTGAGVPLILNSIALNNTRHKGKSVPVGVGLAGPLMATKVTVNDLVLGKFHLTKDFEAWMPNKDSYPNESNKIRRDGTIGSKILGRYRVTFDYFNNKLYLQEQP